MKTMQEMFRGKSFKGVVFFGVSIVMLLGVFALGVRVGERRAHYSSSWGANYERNFLRGPGGMMGGDFERGALRGHEDDWGPGMMRDFGRRDFRNGHGVAGIIVSVSDNMIVIKDADGKENTVAVNDKTIIKNGRDSINVGDLKNNQRIVIIGNPGDNGVVQADLIRVFENGN